MTQAKIIAALASGLTADQVAKAFDLHPSTVYRIAKRDDNPRLIQVLRNEIREKTLEGVKQTTPKALEWLDDVVTRRTSARDADALARALHALEKTSASASGELRRQDVHKKVEIRIELPDWLKPPTGEVIEAEDVEVIEALPPGPDEVAGPED